MDRPDEEIELEAVAASDLARPRPGSSPARRFQDATLGRLRPWIDWFGAGRVVGVALTVAATVFGGWWLLRPADQPTEAMLPYASIPGSAAATSTTAMSGGPATTPATILVHVAGAVGSPGVYELPGGSRVVNAVEAAGGPADEADLATLNLAAVLGDGQRVYVSRAGETPPVVAGPDGAAPASSGPAALVDLNMATVAQLESLPGIGPATATAIIAHRDQHGPFATVDDLEAVRGIGPAKLDALRDLVTT